MNYIIEKAYRYICLFVLNKWDKAIDYNYIFICIKIIFVVNNLKKLFNYAIRNKVILRVN